jgi:hypothetical protein
MLTSTRLRAIGLLRSLLAALAIAISPPANSDAARIDGNLWRNFPAAQQVGLVAGFYLGFKSGLFDGAMYSPKGKERTVDELVRLAHQFHEQEQQQLSEWRGITFQQMADSVDDFYSDPANRRINFEAAIRVSLAKINGKPRAELEAWIEILRGTAAK